MENLPVNQYIVGDCLEVMKGLPAESVQCVVTSPPYWGLRSYSADGQYGLESTPESHIAKMVEVFRDVRRVLRKDGVCWLNYGDSYATNTSAGDKVFGNPEFNKNRPSRELTKTGGKTVPIGLKPKDLCMIPARVAIALQADGWWIRSEIIWCLSGGTVVYAKTQKGEMPMTIKDLVRLDPKTVKLWNGDKWTQVLGWSKTARSGDELEIVLRSGGRISCTPSHRFPTQKGLVSAGELAVGDILDSCTLPEPELPINLMGQPSLLAWFIGLYLAEGSRAGDTIQIAGHIKENSRYEKIKELAEFCGGSCTCTESGNKRDIRIYSRILNAVIDDYISGKIAKDKGLKVKCWQHSNLWLQWLLTGYLEGDGHYDKQNDRWRLGFTRNYKLEQDMRTLCARLGHRITLKPSHSKIGDKSFPSFRGEIRFNTSDHHNTKQQNEVIEIRKARCRYVYDIGVEDDPHLFALASGVLTHNSKPNPMPESCTDRPTSSHEKIYLLTKAKNYFYDADAVREKSEYPDDDRKSRSKSGQKSTSDGMHNRVAEGSATYPTRNLRNVWTISTFPTPDAHFATFPPALVKRCVLAGTSHKACEVCGAPWARVVEKGDKIVPQERKNTQPVDQRDTRDRGWSCEEGFSSGTHYDRKTTGFRQTCDCDNEGTGKCVVLDPFMGSGTTAKVAQELGRDWIGIDLGGKDGEYKKIFDKKLQGATIGLF